MRIDVAFTPAGLAASEVAGRVVFVVDTLRAATTMCAALHHGARGIVPVESIEEAMRLAQTLDRSEVLLTGERKGVRIDGFDLGNSPLEMTPEAVAGKTLVMTTTNGTRALLAAAGGGGVAVYVAAPANMSLAVARAREALEAGTGLLVLCSGRERAFALDDAYTAGRVIRGALDGRRIRKGLNDAALVCLDITRRPSRDWRGPLRRSAAGRALRRIGFEADVEEAAKQDRYPVLPVFADRRLVASRDGGSHSR